jgi:hypothetical protein
MKSRRMRWAGHVMQMGEKKKACRLLVGKRAGKWPARRSTRRWVDNIKVDLTEIGLGGMDWIGLTQDKKNQGSQMNAVMNFPVPLNAGKLLSGCTTGGLSSGTQLHRVTRDYTL